MRQLTRAFAAAYRRLRTDGSARHRAEPRGLPLVQAARSETPHRWRWCLGDPVRGPCTSRR
jgi:hypothetical protein